VLSLLTLLTPNFSWTHFRRVRLVGVFRKVGDGPEGFRVAVGESAVLGLATNLKKKKGEKRTGPALNPLKGSSARLPHALEKCNLRAILNPFIFNGMPINS
jgi:hypothetical protein